MRQSDTIWLSAVAWFAFAPAAIMPFHAASAAADPAGERPADVALSAVAEVGAPHHPVAPEDRPIADAIRALLGNSLARIVEEPKDRDALRAFYEQRSHAPVWVRAAGPTARFRAAVARLKAAGDDGLDASEYSAPELDPSAATPETLARAELALMASAMSYARHAQSGRVSPSRISPNIAVTPPAPDPMHVLKTLAGAADVTAALEAFNPPHRGFRQLRAKLRDLRRSGSAEAEQPRRRGGKRTTKPVDSILSNMERWRWLPRDLGASYVLVNVPDYSLDVVRDGRSVFHTRIVVGKKATPSPIFSDEIETVQLNPTWHVPESIVYGQYLPALSRDPGALRRMGMIVSHGRDGTVSVRQPPGPRNALGRLKVNFPNPFHVYLHDTPDKHLFTREQRAFSSGCMRVQNPDQFAAQVLAIGGADGNYTPARLTSLYGTAERWIPLTSHVPVHLVYMNAYVADDGRLVVRPDIYGYDARVQSALKGRYLVVKERSQRGSQISRSARASRSAGYRSSRPRVVYGPRDGWYEPRRVFGGFFGWHPY